MGMSLTELHSKDVIQCKTGENLGRIDDVIFDTAGARIESVILRGRRRLFGLLGRDEDLVLPWGELKSIGTDVVMVETEIPAAPPRRRHTWLY